MGRATSRKSAAPARGLIWICCRAHLRGLSIDRRRGTVRHFRIIPKQRISTIGDTFEAGTGYRDNWPEIAIITFTL